jgi:hypothetical protein
VFDPSGLTPYDEWMVYGVDYGLHVDLYRKDSNDDDGPDSFIAAAPNLITASAASVDTTVWKLHFLLICSSTL